MKKLIVTFANELNYGAILQAYALQRICDADICNLTFHLKNDKIIKTLFSLPKRLKFRRFKRQYLNLSENVANLNDLSVLSKKYDRITTGSDQVFAFDILDKYHGLFFLDFDHPHKYSYAASFGKNENILGNFERIQKYLSSFAGISIREPSSSKLLNERGIENRCCIDPTMLLTPEQYIKDFELKRDFKKRYILVYAPAIDKKTIELAKLVKKETGLDIVCFNARNRFGKGTKCRPNASPVDFLNYFYNAEIVITNSFHGTCFSVIFKKKFITIADTDKGMRQYELLQKIGLEKRIYIGDNIYRYLVEPEFDRAKEKTFIDDSKKYLKKLG